MSSRRRIGVSIATTEAARRQLMQPVPCWEKMWGTPQDVPASSTFKAYRWVKTDKRQTFSDDEEEPDLPLAPLPDEPEGTEPFEDLDQDEQATSVGAEAASRAVSEPTVPPDNQETEEATPARPKPHPLSMSIVPDSPTPAPEIDGSVLDGEPKPLDLQLGTSEVLDVVGDTSLQVPSEFSGAMDDLDMSQLGPDGEQFEGTGDLSQLQATDSLLGGDIMDESEDPFQPPQ